MSRKGYGLPQVGRELHTLTFARVTGLRQGSRDLLGAAPPPGVTEDGPLTHYYGFAKLLRGSGSVWFKKLTHVRSAGRPGLFIGPVRLRRSAGCWRDLPRRGTLICGRTVDSARGPVFEWWCHDAEPLYALCRLVNAGHMRASASLYRELELPDPAPDDMWALARLLVAGDLGTVADQLRPPRRRDMHPTRRGAHTRARGLALGYAPVEFVWHAAELARCPELLRRFTDYLRTRKLWTAAVRDEAEGNGWTEESLVAALEESAT
jgi:hypothetical protein